MTISTLKISSLLHFLVLIFLMSSCFEKKDNEEKVDSADEMLKADELKDLVLTGLTQLPSWVNHWKNQDASFQIEAFKPTRTLNFELLEYPEEVPYQSNSVFYKHLIAHPKGNGSVDIYGYKIVLPENNTPYFNADSEVAYFKSDGMRERLLFMGPSGGFEEAIWINENYLLVAGFFEEENGISPKLWLIHPESKEYVVFDHALTSKKYNKESYLREKFKSVAF
jgi:hypothetical protein